MLLETVNLKRIYKTGSRTVTAVQNINLNIKNGEFVAVIGHSGSGKSTLLNLLAGLLIPSEGKVVLDGQDIYRLNDKELSYLRNSKIGYIPQGKSVLNNLTVLDNVLLPYDIYLNCKDCVLKARELLEKVGLENLADAYPNSLSGGELRRVAIARALINNPEIIFADEPTSDLDTKNAELVIALLRKIADNGTSVILVTHELDTIGSADEVYTLSEGTLSKTSKNKVIGAHFNIN